MHDHILNNNKQENFVVSKYPHSLVAESFRSLRVNLLHVCKPQQQKQVFLVSSANMGEGKTFCCINLAASLAQTGKKVVVLNFDLRKPKMETYMNESLKSEGLTEYLIEVNQDLRKLVLKSEQENLFYIPSGAKPLNASELLTNEKLLTKLFADLKNEFDYIIVDTPPIGRVADAISLFPYADHHLFVTRHNVTRKNQLKLLFNDLKSKNVLGFKVLVNDIKVKSNKYGYGQGYGYGYGYGYGD